MRLANLVRALSMNGQRPFGALLAIVVFEREQRRQRTADQLFVPDTEKFRGAGRQIDQAILVVGRPEPRDPAGFEIVEQLQAAVGVAHADRRAAAIAAGSTSARGRPWSPRPRKMPRIAMFAPRTPTLNAKMPE